MIKLELIDSSSEEPMILPCCNCSRWDFDKKKNLIRDCQSGFEKSENKPYSKILISFGSKLGFESQSLPVGGCNWIEVVTGGSLEGEESKKWRKRRALDGSGWWIDGSENGVSESQGERKRGRQRDGDTWRRWWVLPAAAMDGGSRVVVSPVRQR
ncbi:unnamed protein product [Ilex paraguariensis]|uniref:Uncharacterized protein n=1 Tax=Ilex paraguariensis TaxID=185542 RepID=A0ABC8U1U1_9AQUA